MSNTISVVYDNKLVTIVDGNLLKATGKAGKYHAMARHVVANADRNGYSVSEAEAGHKRIFTLTPKGV